MRLSQLCYTTLEGKILETSGNTPVQGYYTVDQPQNNMQVPAFLERLQMQVGPRSGEADAPGMPRKSECVYRKAAPLGDRGQRLGSAGPG